MPAQYHADSEYVLHVGIDRKYAEFIRNKHTHLHTHRHTRLYTLVQKNQIRSSITKLCSTCVHCHVSIYIPRNASLIGNINVKLKHILLLYFVI